MELISVNVRSQIIYLADLHLSLYHSKCIDIEMPAAVQIKGIGETNRDKRMLKNASAWNERTDSTEEFPSPRLRFRTLAREDKL